MGKHGDTGTSEREALTAVLVGRADAAAVGAATWGALVRGGDVPPESLAPFWTSPPYNHCNFTVLGSLDEPRAEAWTRHLMAMDWANTDHRRILELEGLHEWVAPDLDGYRDVFEAVRSQAIDADGEVTRRAGSIVRCRGPRPGLGADLRAGCLSLDIEVGEVLELRVGIPRSRTSCRRGAGEPATGSSRPSRTAPIGRSSGSSGPSDP